MKPASGNMSGKPFEVTKAYRGYVLALLCTVYVFNFTDRQILAILLQSIKQEFSLSDTQLGLLGGFAFAVFYTTLGIPLAKLADRKSRRTILAVCVATWSAMTALCGLATGFVSLLLARIGVGIGEAGGSPPSHSLISDYFPPEKRGAALGIYSMGLSGGILVGLLAGGWINQFYGWRMAFFIVGLPGILLALVLRLTLRDPPRGYSENRIASRDTPTALETLRHLWRRRSFRHIPLAAGLYTFAAYGGAMWAPSFFMRSHGMTSGEVGTWLALIYGLAGAAGTFFGGYFCDRLSNATGDQRWYMWLPGAAIFVSVPFVFAVYLSPSPVPALLFLIVPYFLSHMWLGPAYAMTQGLAGLRMRAMAAAIFLFINNIIGLALGPWAVGILSDLLSGRFGIHSLRYALLGVTVVMSMWAAVHFLLAARTLREDLEMAADEMDGA